MRVTTPATAIQVSENWGYELERAGFFVVDVPLARASTQRIQAPPSQDYGTPKAVVVFVSGASNRSGTVTPGARIGIGFTDGTTQRACSMFAEDNDSVGSALTGGRHDTATLIQLPGATSSAIDAEASWSSWLTNGMVISIADQPAAAVMLTCVFFYGDQCEAYVRDVTSSASDGGTADIDGAAFTPNAAIFAMMATVAFAADSTVTNARLGVGLATKGDGSPTQGCTSFFERNTPTTSTTGAISIRDDCIFEKLVVSGAGVLTAGPTVAVTSWLSSGVQITTAGAAEAQSGAVLLLRMGNAPQAVSIPTFGTMTTGTKNITAAGFRPREMMTLSSALGTKNSAAQTSRSFGFGVDADGVSGGAQWFSRDGQVSSETDSCAQPDTINITTNGGAHLVEARFQQFTATGVDMLVVVAAPTNDRNVVQWYIGKHTTTIAPTGIASTSAFGTPTLTQGGATQTVSPTGIASDSAFGTPTLTSSITVSPTGIASDSAFGTPTLIGAAVTVSPVGIASTSAFGTPILVQGVLEDLVLGLLAGRRAAVTLSGGRRAAVTLSGGRRASVSLAGSA